MTHHPGRHLVMGLPGPELGEEERTFLREARPSGVILFARNLGDMESLEALLVAIRQAVDPAPLVWIDQEGGRVQRLREPFTRYPTASRLAALELQVANRGRRLAQMSGWLCGMELASLGIGVDCAPVLDIREEGADPVIGDRAFGTSPVQVVALASAWLDGFGASGLAAVGKHFPGHGAANADSHKALPVVGRSLQDLERRELVPFRALAPRLPAIMTAHLVMSAVEPEIPATWSRLWLHDILRKAWHYPGVIASDALEMGALSGSLAERARRSLLGGCDMVLSCVGRLEDHARVLEGIGAALGEMPTEERTASLGRVDHFNRHHAVPVGDWRALLRHPDYREARQMVEEAAEERLERDPTVGH
ncbi:MAG: beta-N-acetylhexosaminidase [Magnetococcales bacterium]|nr:beta-N-acetylhexosaminidase [Magnetococcales bacterium]